MMTEANEPKTEVEECAGRMIFALLDAGENLDQGVTIKLGGLWRQKWRREPIRLGDFEVTVKRVAR